MKAPSSPLPVFDLHPAGDHIQLGEYGVVQVDADAADPVGQGDPEGLDAVLRLGVGGGQSGEGGLAFQHLAAFKGGIHNVAAVAVLKLQGGAAGSLRLP